MELCEKVLNAMNFFVASLIPVIVLPLLLVVNAVSQTPGSVEVDGPRPLMQMVDRLEALANVPINYEDPRYLHPSDIEDVADKVSTAEQRSRNPAAKILVPRGGKLAVALPAEGEKVDTGDIGSLLTQMRMAYEAMNLPGRFITVERNGVWYVEPSAALNEAGTMQKAGSIMGSPITIPWQRRNAGECLNLILNQVAQLSGSRVVTGMIPFLAFAGGAEVNFGADDEPAVTVLFRLLARLSRGGNPNPFAPAKMYFSYRLLYDPGFNYYVFNARVVERVRPVKNAAPQRVVPKGSSNPFMAPVNPKTPD